MSRTKLTPKMTLNSESLFDHLTMMCKTLEEALLYIDAEPGKDYTKKDLMDWAVQLTAPNAGFFLKKEWTEE